MLRKEEKSRSSRLPRNELLLRRFSFETKLFFKSVRCLDHISLSGAPNEKNRKNVSNAVFCFLMSFYGLLKGHLCELILFDLFGCGS